MFAGVGKEDTEKEAEQAVNKVLKAKFWPDENGAQVRMRHTPIPAQSTSDRFAVEEERPGHRGRSALW